MFIEIYANSKNFQDVNERTQWENDNNEYFKKPARSYPFPFDPTNHEYWEYTIHFAQTDHIIKQAEWLKSNYKHIDFEKSRHNIENSHLMQISGEDVDSINTHIYENAIKKYSVEKLIELGCVFDYNYEKYMQFEIKNNQLITPIPNVDFKPTIGKRFFSRAFFKSILENNAVDADKYDSCYFTFVLWKVDLFYNIIIMVEFPADNNGQVNKLFYDYSQIPPKKLGFDGHYHQFYRNFLEYKNSF